MRTVRLGARGPEVPALGYGSMSFTNFYGPATEDGSHAILDACLDLGITHIDTANAYGLGRAETFIGNWLAKRGDNPFSIATKAAIARDADGKRYFDNSPEHLESELDKSLQRLGVEAVDLFYVHRRDPGVDIEEVAGALGELVRKGKTKAIGFSEIAPTSLRRAMEECPVDAVQSEYSLATRSPEMGLVQSCAELGVALVAFSPVGRALLTDHPPTAEAVRDMEWMKVNPRFTGGNLERNVAATDPFRALAADMGISAAGLAIAWAIGRGDHVLPIPGTRSVQHLREAAEGLHRVLTAEEIAAVERVLPIGWAHGDRYSAGQWVGPEKYC